MLLRPIDGVHQGEHGDWVAELRCGHRQHAPHKPLGIELPCALCGRFEIPHGYSPYKRTPDFTTLSIPDALRREHSTKPGVWGLIHVLDGQLRYVVELPLQRDETLVAGGRGVIVPEVLHHVHPEGEVRFFVEFLRRNQ